MLSLTLRGKRKNSPEKLPSKIRGFVGVQIDKSRPFPTSLKRVILISVFLNIASILFVITAQRKLPPELPLFYGLAEGEEQLAKAFLLTLPALVSLGMTCLNSVISFFWENEFLREVLILTSLGITILSTIATIKIAFLIGSF